MSPKKTTPKKGGSPQKGRRSPSTARNAELADVATAAEPAQRVSRRSPAKSGAPVATGAVRRSASPAKVTKRTSPAKSATKTRTSAKKTVSSPTTPAVKSSPGRGAVKDNQFLEPPGDDSQGYKEHESTADIIKAIDGRTLTAIDKRLVKAIQDLEDSPSGNECLHADTAAALEDMIEAPYSRGEEPDAKVHHQIYWRYKALCQQMLDADDGLTTEDAYDSESDSESIVVATMERSPKRAQTSEKPPPRSQQASASTGKLEASHQQQEEVLQAVENAAFDLIWKQCLGHGDADGKGGETRLNVSQKQIEAAWRRGQERAKGVTANMRLENALQLHAHSRGQPRELPDVDQTGVVRPSQRGSSRARHLPAKTPEASSPSQASDPRKAAQDKQAREAKRKADIEARQKIVNQHQAFPADKQAWMPAGSKRGNIVSFTNPPLVDIVVGQDGAGRDIVQQRINPFFETLPGPEVWHRNMPPYFSFGETKYMEQVISDQINRDLARAHPDTSKRPESSSQGTTRSESQTSILSSAIRGAKSFFGSNATEREAQVPDEMEVDDAPRPPTRRRDHWELPELSEAEKRAVKMEAMQRVQGAATLALPGKKRVSESSRSSAASPASWKKRSRVL